MSVRAPAHSAAPKPAPASRLKHVLQVGRAGSRRHAQAATGVRDLVTLVIDHLQPKDFDMLQVILIGSMYDTINKEYYRDVDVRYFSVEKESSDPIFVKNHDILEAIHQKHPATSGVVHLKAVLYQLPASMHAADPRIDSLGINKSYAWRSFAEDALKRDDAADFRFGDSERIDKRVTHVLTIVSDVANHQFPKSARRPMGD